MLVQGLEQQIDKINREISKIQDKTEQRRQAIHSVEIGGRSDALL